jgi:hypothetical protein
MALSSALIFSGPAFGGLIITGTFTAAFNTDFGANAAAAQAAWNAAASAISANFSDNIHINITVDAVTGTSVFGQSNTFVTSLSYANMRAALIADAKTADDALATGAGGSITAADPTGGQGTWFVTRAEDKALGLLADDMSNDGTTRFGAGNPFTFSGPIAPGTYDFTGVAAHEISEVMGRLGLSGITLGNTPNTYTLIDAYGFTGAGARALTGGAGDNFSIDNGTTLLKLYNNQLLNGLDTRDWAPGTNDAFNQFSNSGVVNGLSTVDLREMDVIGYDRVVGTPEPSTGVLLVSALMGGVFLRRRLKAGASR